MCAGPPPVRPWPADVKTLLFTGDVSFARDIKAHAARFGGSVDYAFDGLRRELRAADLTVANLESPLWQNSGVRPADAVSKAYNLQGHEDGAAALSRAGIDVVSVANNHIMVWTASRLCRLRGAIVIISCMQDLGVEAFRFTLWRLRENSVRVSMHAAYYYGLRLLTNLLLAAGGE
jgi:hypothetical protein